MLVLILTVVGLIHRNPFGGTAFLIRDGNRLILHTTRTEELGAILCEAGVDLTDADYQLEQTETGPVIRILRQQRITVDYYGNEMEVYSNGETVGQLLERLELKTGESDLISVTPESSTFDGMHLRIARILRQEQTYTAVMPCETISCSDPTLPEGIRQVLREGRNGELLRTAEVTYINGIEASRTVLSEEVTVQPVSRVVAVGTGQQFQPVLPVTEPVIGDGIITLPTGEVLTYGRVISSLATAYCDKGKTATGTQARVGAIAVDPAYIPYGTRMFIMSKDGQYIYGIATAEDCGSKEFIYGTRIDLHYDTEYECRQFGARMCWVYILH